MKSVLKLATAAFAALAVVAGVAFAQDASLQTLRGAQIDEPVTVVGVPKQDKKRFGRAYRHQPPLIPHAVDQYQIDTNANQCLGCHDWSNAGERNAPTLSMTHYLDRDGRQLDEIAGTRWFCNQCHVPQADAEPLVDNTFVPSFTR